jgi:hypothetical protein
MLFHTETRDGITYRLYAYYDDTSVKGNAIASGDDKLDARVERSILKRLDAGDVWAWASVHVTAEIDDISGIEGDDHLGGCSYASYKQFIKIGGYWDDMKATAREDLFSKLNTLVNAAKAL